MARTYFLQALIFVFIHSLVSGAPFDADKPLSQGPDFYGEWDPPAPWLTGINQGWNAVDGSFGYGAYLFGSQFLPEQAYDVDIIISASVSTLAQTYRRDLDFPNYPAAGVGVFPGSVWDVSDAANPRRLNVVLVEDNNEKPANLKWDPDDSPLGGREYFFIMDSDYDGTGLTYANTDGRWADNVYGWWPRLITGETFHATDPITLKIRVAKVEDLVALPGSDSITLEWSYSSTGADSFKVYGGIAPAPATVIATLPITDRSYVHGGRTLGEQLYYRVEATNSAGEQVYRSVEVSAFAQVLVDNIQLRWQWNGRSDYGDIWGYVDPTTGKEYALLNVRGEGLSIIELGQGVPPVEVGFAAAPTSSYPDAKDVKVYDHYAILINENFPAQIIDLADPANPVTVAEIFVGGAGTNGGAHNAFVDGNYLYITGGQVQGVHIYDLTDPVNPVLVGGFHEYYYHDFYVRNDTAYASAGTNGVDVLDLADKSNPVRITTFDYEGQWVHNTWATEDGNYLIVGDENGTAGQWTRIFDIRDLASPVMVSEIIIDSSATTHNSYVRGTNLFIAHYTEGLRVWDISDPANPFEVAFYDTYLPQDYGFGGMWSVFPFFPSHKIIVSDRFSGLFVFGLDPSLATAGEPQAVPENFYLEQNYPNPFNAGSRISFGLPRDGRVNLVIYDLLGRAVTTLLDGWYPAGRHTVSWNPGNQPSGVYFARMTSADRQHQTIKMLLLK